MKMKTVEYIDAEIIRNWYKDGYAFMENSDGAIYKSKNQMIWDITNPEIYEK